MHEIIKEILKFEQQLRGRFGEMQLPLPGGLSVTEAQVLTALAHEDNWTARGLMKRLGVDAGYMSRLLAGFERRKLIKRERSRRDRRAMLITLTSRGADLAAEIDATEETRLLGKLKGFDKSARDTLVAALRQCGEALTPRTQGPLVYRPLALGDAGWIIHRHGALIAVEQGWDIRFEGMCAGILAEFIRDFDARYERSWVAERDGQILGSLFLVRANEQTAKLRLLYVDKEARGMGLATKLIQKSITFARSKGYRRLVLFTTSENVAARRIYERLGFRKMSEEPTDLFGNGLMGEEWALALV